MSVAPPTLTEKLEIKLLRQPHPDWETFLDAQPATTLFQRSRWAEIVRSAYNAPIYNGILSAKGEMVCGFLGNVFDLKILKLLFANTPYGGIAGDTSMIPRLLEGMIPLLKREPIDLIRITQPPLTFDDASLGFETLESVFHVLDLQGFTPETLVENMSYPTRRDIRRSLRSGIEIHEIRSLDEVEKYYALYRETMRRKNTIGPHTRRFYQVIFERMVSRGEAQFLLGVYRGKPVTGAVLFFDRDTTYLLGNASCADFLTLAPNEFIIYHSLLQTLARGKRYFDFMTSSLDQQGLIRFKEKWGSKRRPFHAHLKVLTPWRYQLYQWAWNRLNTRPWASLVQRFWKA